MAELRNDPGSEALDLLLTNATVVALDAGRGGSSSVLAGHAVGIRGDRIAVIGPSSEVLAAYQAPHVMDCRGGALLPGLVDAHLHTCQQLVRGYADDISVLEWLTRIVGLEAVMTEDDVYASARLACIEMVASGTTSFIEACANPAYIDAVGQAIVDSGLRAALTRSTMEHQEPDWPVPAHFLMDASQNLAATRSMIDRWHGAGDGRISAWCGWRQQWNLSDELLVDLVALARERGVGVHGHLATRRFGQIELLDSLGVLGPELVVAHAIRFTERDRELIEAHDVKINHNPGASMHGAYGSAVAGSFPELYERGVCVCLGCDGAANGNTLDMWQVTRLAATLHKETRQDATVFPAQDALAMATREGARALGMHDIGSVAVGMKADLQVLDLNQPHLVPATDVVNNLVYCASGGDVVTTIVDGRVLMEDRVVKGIDVAAAVGDATERSARIRSRLDANFGFSDAAVPANSEENQR